MDDMIVDVLDSEANLPGAGFNFQDATDTFREAAMAMQPGSFLFMDEFTLHDAMSAFEIGEPRLDSGLIIEGDQRPPFDPTTPLLPEELCWILDRSFSYEMEWHTGNLLSHTVYTLLYVHHLAAIEIDFMTSQATAKYDQSRPSELIYVVLRACVMGLLKCCDLSWRELNKGGVQDMEDWQGEKCDISLLEGVPVRYIVSQLEEASTWLLKTTKLPNLWRNALRARINLRKSILQLMDFDLFTDQARHQDLLCVAYEQLNIIQANPSPEPSPESPARLAFDPSVARSLKTFVPLRIIPVPPPDATWAAFNALLDGWQELSCLSRTNNLATWELVGNLRVWLPEPMIRIPYLRSSTQSTFYGGLLILDKYTFVWMVDRFFFEALGVPYDSLVKTVKEHWTGSEAPPLGRMERILYKLITPHIRGQWLNPPRRRRHLSKSLLNWHSLYVTLTEIMDGLDHNDLPKNIMQISNVALVWRLSAIREVLLSGFQLELFSSEERPVAYWYAAEVIDAHLSCLDEMLPVVPITSLAYREMQFQHQLLTALQAMSAAVFVTSMSRIDFSWVRLRPAFYRRYKWAFRPEYDKWEITPVAAPELRRLMIACSETLKDEFFSPRDSIKMAETILRGIIASGSSGGWAGQWENDRIQVVRNLVSACERLHGLPTSVDRGGFDVSRLKWDVQVHPWFPSVPGLPI